MIDNYEKLKWSNNIPKAAIATISLAIPVLSKAVAPAIGEWAGSSTLVNRAITSGTAGIANAGVQGFSIYKDPSQTFSWASFGTAMVVGGTTANMGTGGTVGINTAGAGISSVIDGQSPWLPMAGGFIGSYAGYKATDKVLPYAEKKFNPWSNGFNEKHNVNMPSISAPTSQSLWPSAVGGITGAGVAEYTKKN
ncbi:hypothetical protein [Erwinia rhapontici]|uniref:hypothetical protein n=1 Tax=Erwinia rhapontici TaxID=55212 RepID=UPI003B9F84FC